MRSTIVIAMIIAGGLIAAAPAHARFVSRSFAVTAEVPCSFTVPKRFSPPPFNACAGADARKGAGPTVQWTQDKAGGDYLLTVRF